MCIKEFKNVKDKTNTMAKIRKKSVFVKPSAKSKSKPKLLEVSIEKSSSKLTVEKIENMIKEELRERYAEFFGEEIPKHMLDQLMKSFPSREELDEIDRVQMMVDTLCDHIAHIEGKLAPYHDADEIIAVIAELPEFSVNLFRKELILISEKSSYKEVRQAAEEKLNTHSMDCN